MASTASRLEQIDQALSNARGSWGERGEVVLNTGIAYASDEPVTVHVRKREHRYDLSDSGRAVQQAGRPEGWLAVAERIAAAEGFNVNRSGAVFVPVVEGRDIASLVLRLADTSRDVYVALLELPVR